MKTFDFDLLFAHVLDRAYISHFVVVFLRIESTLRVQFYLHIIIKITDPYAMKLLSANKSGSLAMSSEISIPRASILLMIRFISLNLPSSLLSLHRSPFANLVVCSRT